MLFNFTILLLLMTNAETAIYKFNKQSTLDNWILVNDVVMGGQSTSSFSLDDKGHGVFQGKVSLENNGGFASLRYRFERSDIQSFNSIAIRLKGDGLNYQFRVKSKKYDQESYVYNFETSGKWEWIEIPLGEMYPSWRGRTLNMPNYPGQTMEVIAILIGNKKPDEFHLEIDQILLK